MMRRFRTGIQSCSAARGRPIRPSVNPGIEKIARHTRASVHATTIGFGVGENATTFLQKLGFRSLSGLPPPSAPESPHGSGFGLNRILVFKVGSSPAPAVVLPCAGEVFPDATSAPPEICAAEEACETVAAASLTCTTRRRTPAHSRNSLPPTDTLPCRICEVSVHLPRLPAQTDASPTASPWSGSASGAPHAPDALSPIAGRFPAVCRALCRCGRPALARQPDSKSNPETHRQCAGTTGAF